MVVLMEGEVWPNFLAACIRRGIPTAVVNGRMSADKGYPRYKKLGPLAGRLFNRLTAIGVQDESYAGMFRSLGVDPARLHVTGMIKYDTAEVADKLPGQEALAAAMGVAQGDRLIVAGGTGPGEEPMLLEMFARLKRRRPQARLAIIPRKPERFDEVAKLISAAGLAVVRRSQTPDGSTPPADRSAVILGDTMGELRKFYSLAACVFVGRSLVPMGGSDMIEAAALGKPTAYGPHTFNFPQAQDLAIHGCSQVSDAAALESQLDAWLSDASLADQAGRAAQQFIRNSQGATKRNVDMLCKLLGREPAQSDGGIATDAIRQERAGK
jgi:3-deoxy-D-manno-octulosonic-acid transferase